MKGFIKIICLVAWFLTGTAAVWAQESSVPTDYRLAAGDRLRVSVYGHEDLSGDFEVDGAGQLSLPLIQDIDAANKTLNELEKDITNALMPDFLKNPRVSVEILNYRPFYIVGEVNAPGSYAYVSGMTVINAVAMAGGFTHRAQKGNIKISREKADGRDEISGEADTAVMPGDVIEIGERFF
jgi:protein involved in polysaccharide export with SLBB domain